MSNKEKLLAYAEEMTEADLIFVVNMIEAYKAAEQKRREAEEDARDLEIYKEYLKNPDAMEFMPIEDCAKELGVTLKGQDDAEV